jgi:ataxia telangiectasia mutated family protein
LPVAGGEYFAGLSKIYLKVLGSVLEHEAHIEHLDEADWLSTVDYCLQGIEQYGSDSLNEAVTVSRTFPSLTGATSSSDQTSSTKLSVRSLGDATSSGSITKRDSEELLQCLLYLISASNAPILERAEEILHGIMHFLDSHGSFASPIHQVAFSALNFMLCATNADKSSLSQSLALRLVPIIGHLWSSKSVSKDEMLNSIKDEMLITILRLRLHMERIVSAHRGDFEQKLEDLEKILRIDYSKRLERDQLQLDDLDMSTLCGENTLTTSIHVGSLRLKTHAPRAERSWAILAALSILDGLLHVNQEPLGSSAEDDENDSSRHPRKRRRITRRFDGLLELVSSDDIGERRVAFQVLLCLLPSLELSQYDLDEILERLSPYVIDRRHSIGSWAMLCIAR